MNEDKFKKSNNTIIVKFNNFVELFKKRKIDEIRKFDIKELYFEGKFIFDIRYILSVFDYIDTKNYKYENDFIFYEYLSNLFKEYELNDFSFLLRRLCKTKRGNYLLNELSKNDKFKNEFNSNSKNKITDYLDLTSRAGTLPNFLFWEKHYKKIFDTCKIGTEIFISALSNSDDRIFKYIMKNKKYYLIDDKKKNFYLDLSASLFCNMIPDKYILRRLKFLSSYFDFSSNLDNFLVHVSNLKIMFKILKFYYKDNDCQLYVLCH